MAIPKIIHYCWFGNNPKPELALKCIKSWQKYCPDYKIIEWNESNYNIGASPLYVRQAYECKKWAFVTDYVRLQLIYENGGIYLDTDVELKKPLDPLLEYKAYFGLEDGRYINTGLGFGAEKGHPILMEMMSDYQNISFVNDQGAIDQITCPVRNTNVFLKYGLKQDDSRQILKNDIVILPTIFLCPLSYSTGDMIKSNDTFSIHHFASSWYTEEQLKVRQEWRKTKKKLKRREVIHNIKHLPNRVLLSICGKEKYEKLKKSLKGNNNA